MPWFWQCQCALCWSLACTYQTLFNNIQHLQKEENTRGSDPTSATDPAAEPAHVDIRHFFYIQEETRELEDNLFRKTRNFYLEEEGRKVDMQAVLKKGHSSNGRKKQ